MGARPATILVIDDEQGFLRLIRETLEREGFLAVTAQSGQKAIAWLSHKTADLMLLDLKLRDIEGKELIDHLASIHRLAPFIIITGHGDERVAVDMMKRGALDYLVKDMDFVQFIPEVVRRALDQLAAARRLADAERALRQSEASLIAAQSVAHVGSYQFDSTRAKHLHWSPETFRIVGLVPGEAELSLEEYGNRVVHRTDQPRFLEAIARALREGSRYDLEYRIVRPDGSIRYVHSLAEPEKGPNGEVIRMLGTLQDITEQRELEHEVREISAREQRRIGQELHDGLGQQLTAIELMCESLRSDLAAIASRLEPQAATICEYLRKTIRQARSLAHGLAAFQLGAGGLQSALGELAESTSSLGRIRCRAECQRSVRPKQSAALHLYRIAQEAVSNAVQHSSATEITMQLSQRDGLVTLRIADNGKGLPDPGIPRRGIGLRLMKHRARMLGADLEVSSVPRQGVTVACTMRSNS